MNRNRTLLVILLTLNLVAVALNVRYGSVRIPWSELSDPRWHYIVWQSRLPAAITALMTGAVLGCCGLLLQTYFRNPLAGPSILGITSGANLMVALVTLGSTTVPVLSLAASRAVPIVAAMLGAFAVLFLLLYIGHRVRTIATLLIAGILVSYLTSAVITLLGYYASAQGVQQLLLWGMGDFGGVGARDVVLYVCLTGACLVASLFLAKPMNGWMLGEQYAQNLGINLRRTRLLLLAVTGTMAAVTTAWCGPISFIGLSMPHVARLLLRTDDHRLLLPTSALLGSLCASLCLRLSTMPEGGTLLPINALTPLFGVPVILYVLLRK